MVAVSIGSFYRPQRQKKAPRVQIFSDTIMRKMLIVKDWNGYELERVAVEREAYSLSKAWGAAYDAAVKRHPRGRIFCDSSEGVVVRQ